MQSPSGSRSEVTDPVQRPERLERLERLWAPHRLAYITSDPARADADRSGCPFCDIPDQDDEALVLARGGSVYAVLNLHPYNPGHLMVVPYRHVAELEDLTGDETRDLADFTRQAVVAVKRASSPHGFTVGLNLGGVAGVSLADHLHQHVVPRWGGDSNFMTVLSDTKVMPQLLADTAGLLREVWPA